MKLPFKISLGSSGFEHKIEENLNWRKFNIDIIISLCVKNYFVNEFLLEPS
jgi:hypothetical protein